MASSAEPEAPPHAGVSLGRLSAVVVVCIALDQLTKWLAVQHLAGKGRMAFWGDTVRMEYTVNEGAFLGLGSDWPPQVRFWVLTVGTSLFLVAMVWVLLLNRHGERGELVALALVIGGGVGNMIDRLFHEGAVVDFLNVGIGTLRTGIFNVADAAITGGVLLLLTLPFFRRQKTPAASA